MRNADSAVVAAPGSCLGQIPLMVATISRTLRDSLSDVRRKIAAQHRSESVFRLGHDVYRLYTPYRQGYQVYQSLCALLDIPDASSLRLAFYADSDPVGKGRATFVELGTKLLVAQRREGGVALTSLSLAHGDENLSGL